ncbi:hypothetical protein [Flavonifractor sp. An10]|uniref:hypothetical protein n=1 Tax=Flavonifractor sp. An10 TaxID=1965537 RepID=UPI000B378157|nr:hypothetical protein [Flavonifractor sp. An10]OUQ83858.1 hypothetical protein B5E42_04130 [Flavonifractor sp. An10]
MITVIVPVIVLIVLIMVKKIPFVGGKVTYALIIAGLLALLMGGVFNPLQWVLAWIDGIDKLAWIMALNIFGSIYAASQTEMKTLDLVLNVARVSLGRSPKGLIVAIILVLGLAGSLLGDSVASATVVGILVIGILSDMQISAAGIGCIIMMGASLGSIMPPITQAVFLASSLAQVDTTPVVNISYITVGIGFVICTIYAVFAFVKIKALPEHLIPNKTAGQIMHGNWHLMLPLAVLILLVILQTAAGINLVQMATGPLMGWLSNITILKGLSNNIVTFLITATLVSLFFKPVRKNLPKVVKNGVVGALPAVKVELGAALLLGAFYAAGQIEAVQAFAASMEAGALKVSGGLGILLISALTGSQSTGQNTIFSFLAPALASVGVDPVHAAVASAHIASGGQAFPPVSAPALAISAVVESILVQKLGKDAGKVDPIRVMVLTLPMSIYFVIVGFLFLFI